MENMLSAEQTEDINFPDSKISFYFQQKDPENCEINFVFFLPFNYKNVANFQLLQLLSL